MNKYGIYLISDPKYPISKVEDAFQSGQIKYFQYRAKNISDEQFITEGQAYQQLCNKYNVQLIVNDRVHLASAIGAIGIHVGQSDMDAKQCRQLHPDKLIGVSANTISEVEKAISDGVDYIGVGAVFATSTKSDARPVSLEDLKTIYDNHQIDIVTIGGITTSNVMKVIPYSDGVAICSDILSAKSPSNVVAEYKRIIEDTKK